ncbi:hypothetical protein [uncultured Flavonifractor sp.]|uniref:hypothetical protein n=1 Tax=uncultured Flavonifractor sp. TaxID=1193534 RepID=UPI00260FFE38|nr:hypothetical protein [uncultured Flavonifractor sp.]
MKKLVSVLFALIAALCILSGCAMNRTAYSEQEKQMIAAANQLISSEYDVIFDEDDFSYNVGKQIGEMEFVSLASEEEPPKDFEDIVSVSALKTDIHEKGEVYAYSVTFHSKTNDILDISVSIGE